MRISRINKRKTEKATAPYTVSMDANYMRCNVLTFVSMWCMAIINKKPAMLLWCINTTYMIDVVS